MPAGVVTEIGPVVAPSGTVAVMLHDPQVKVAAVPLNVTEVAPPRLSPWMVMMVPGGPLVGENESMYGGRGTWKQQLVVVPLGDVTEIGPLVAPLGTVVCISESESTVNTAGFPSNATRVAPVKLQPRISTLVPMCPPIGVNELIVGSGEDATVNEDSLLEVPSGVVTEIGPVVAPSGTVAWSREFESTLKPAAVPLNVTEVVSVNSTRGSRRSRRPRHPLARRS